MDKPLGLSTKESYLHPLGEHKLTYMPREWDEENGKDLISVSDP